MFPRPLPPFPTEIESGLLCLYNYIKLILILIRIVSRFKFDQSGRVMRMLTCSISAIYCYYYELINAQLLVESIPSHVITDT